jgi:hypothetical protein
MKKILSAIVLSISTASCAQAQTNEQVWGTLIGGGLGYVFGDGSGHQKEIAAASAVGGLLLGTHASRNRYEERVVYSEPVYTTSREVYYGRPSTNFGSYCAETVPPSYARNPGARGAWIRGCVSRMQQEQFDLEQEAFEAGVR